MQEIMTCQNCLIGWMESAARNFTYPLGMKTALYKKRKKVEKSPFFRFFFMIKSLDFKETISCH